MRRRTIPRSSAQRLVLIFYSLAVVLLFTGVFSRGLHWGLSNNTLYDHMPLGLLLGAASAVLCLYFLILYAIQSGYYYRYINGPTRSKGIKRVMYWPIFLLAVPSLPLLLQYPLIVMCLSGGLLLLLLFASLFRPKDYSPEVLRGSKVISIYQAADTFLCLAEPDEHMIMWAGTWIPERYDSQHLGAIGSIGEGKSITHEILLGSLLPSIVGGSDRRCIMFDIKGDMVQFLRENARCPVHVLNPFYKDSVAWDMARDTDSPAVCLQLASNLIEKEKGGNVFFSNSAIGVLAAALIAYTITKPEKWSLAEVLYTLSDRPSIESLLNSVPQTQHYARQLASHDEKTISNILSTVHSNAAMLSPVANLLHRTEQKFSLNQWLTEDESILVLNLTESLRCPTLAFYRVLFQRLSELILSLSESDTRRIYLFNDELAACGYWPSLTRLMWGGRSKGFRAILAWQTMEGLRTVYQKEADDIAGLIGSKLLLRTSSVETAKFYSQVIGECEVSQWTKSERPGASQSGPTMTEGIVKKEAVLPSQFMHMPRANRQRFYGYYVNPDVGPFYGPVYFADLLPKKKNVDVPELVSRPLEDQYLPEDLIIADLERETSPSLDDFKRITIDDHIDDEIMDLLRESERE